MSEPTGMLRPGLLVLLISMLLGWGSQRATADEGAAVAEAPAPPAPVEADAEPSAEPSAEPAAEPSAESPSSDAEARLEAVLAQDPGIVLLMGLLRFGTAILGAWVLYATYRTWSRGRAGVGPGLAPPVGATTIATPLLAVLALLLYFVAPALLREAVVRSGLADVPTMGLAVLSLILVGAPLVTGLLLRRRRLVPPEPAPHAGALRRGFLTFCAGNALALPALFLGAALLHAFGEKVTTYQVVEQAVDPTQPANLWLTALLAVVVAPIVEETIFRGALYPALRDTVGGARGVWVAAVVVSALFAAVHAHPASFLPLFCLAMVFTWVFERTNSLATVIVAHAFFNGASMIPLLVARMKGIL